MKEQLVSNRYFCKVCGDKVPFSTNPEDMGAWRMGAPAMQVLTNLNIDSREMVANLRCSKCMKAAQDVFNKA